MVGCQGQPHESKSSSEGPTPTKYYVDKFSHSSSSALNICIPFNAIMSREAYAPPTLQRQGSTFGVTSEIDGPSTQYLCGDCNAEVPLKKGDPIRCKDCGYRVLYKERTRRYLKNSCSVMNVGPVS